MNILEKITIEIGEKISKASLNKTTKPTILFCGCNPQVKKDMHKRAKRIGLIIAAISFVLILRAKGNAAKK